MYIPFLSIRYMAKARSSLFSIGGVLVGVAVVVVVSSVMNGYVVKFEDFIRGDNGDLVVRGPGVPRLPYAQLSKRIREVQGVRACSGYAVSGALLTLPMKQSSAVQVRGIDPVREAEVGRFTRYLSDGRKPEDLFDTSETAAPFQVVLGSGVLPEGTYAVGDVVMLSFPTATSSWQSRSFTIRGVFSSGYYSVDSMVCLVPLAALQQMLGLGPDAVNAVNIAVKPDSDIKAVQRQVVKSVGRIPNLPQNQSIFVSTWRNIPEYRTRLAATSSDRTLLFFIAMIVVVISGFVVMARLLLTVTTKTRDIGILRAIGTRGRGVVAIFMVDGLLIGVVGAGLGIALGNLFASNIMSIARFIEKVFAITVFPQRIYEFDSIPVYLSHAEALWIGLLAVVVSFLFSAVPALLAVRKNPVEALRYE